MSKKPLRSQARNIVFNVYRKIREEEGVNQSQSLILKRVVPLTGVSSTTIRRIIGEGTSNDGVFSTPGKNRRGGKKKINLDSFDLELIRNKIMEIDPDLFITCRLCLKDRGSYQITPVVLQDIKFCFDIVFDPFDGLSQVICKACKHLLTLFSNTKKECRENHEKLLNLKSVNVIVYTPKDTTASDKATKCSNTIEKFIKKTFVNNSIQYTKKTNNDIQPENLEAELDEGKEECIPNGTEVSDCAKVTSSDAIDICTKETVESNGIQSECTRDKSNEWKVGFQEYYACRYCNQHCSSLTAIKSHLKTHAYLISLSHSLIKKHCNVRLNRVDDLPNITGNLDLVQLNNKTLVLDKIKNYYMVYLPITSKAGEKRKTSNLKLNSSDEDVVCVTSRSRQNKRRKRIRLMSSSSEESSQNDKNDEKSDTIVSDAASCSKDAIESEYNDSNVLSDCLEIEKETSDCDNIILSKVLGIYNRHVSNLEELKAKPDKAVLNRKVLNIGRKVMSKQGISSPGLLKYLEQSNLSIAWKPNTPSKTSSKELDLIRIIPKVKEKQEAETYECIPVIDARLHSKTYTILNADPVVNPKQFPIRKHVPVNKGKPSKTNAPIDCSETICLNDSDDNEPDATPVLNGLSSLTSVPTTSQTTVAPVATSVIVPPRIKCKPTSELMSAEALSYLGQSNCENWTPNTTAAPSLLLRHLVTQESQPPLLLRQLVTQESQPSLPLRQPVTQESNVPDVVVASNGVERTSTMHPFEHFQSLLLKHNLVLQSSVQPLDSNIPTMFKFKLRTGRSGRLVSLMLSLSGAGNTFCIRAETKRKEFININNMRPEFQLELLKSLASVKVYTKVMEFSKTNNSEMQTKQFFLTLQTIVPADTS